MVIEGWVNYYITISGDEALKRIPHKISNYIDKNMRDDYIARMIDLEAFFPNTDQCFQQYVKYLPDADTKKG